MVGLLPLCAVTVFEGEFRQKYPELSRRLARFLQARPELTAFIHDPVKPGFAGLLPGTRIPRAIEVSAVEPSRPSDAEESQRGQGQGQVRLFGVSSLALNH